MRFTLELSNRDLRFFREALKRSRDAVRHADETEIIEAIDDVLTEIKNEEPLPDFVAKRIPQLESMISMLKDDEWCLPIEQRERMLATFVYFGDPEDIVPDHIPARVPAVRSLEPGRKPRVRPRQQPELGRRSPGGSEAVQHGDPGYLRRRLETGCGGPDGS